MTPYETARAFLAVPPTDLPGATLIDDIDGGNPWEALRELAAGRPERALDAAGYASAIRVHAVHPDWREGVTIELPDA